MLQNLANFLLGTTTDNTAARGVENETHCNNTNIRLISTTAEDDEWIIVDRDSEGNSEVSSDDGSDFRDVHLPSQPTAGRYLLTRTSSSSSLPSISNMEESWFVTPPPCFTSAGPIHMETSPLENLLIEHPSMSVYHQHVHTRRHYATSIRTVSPPSEGTVIREEEETAVEARNQAEQRPVVRPHQLQILQQQHKKQIVKQKTAQKVQMQKAYEALKRGNLDRKNKAREVNSRNRRQRRGERSQGANRSHANNNRKC